MDGDASGRCAEQEEEDHYIGTYLYSSSSTSHRQRLHHHHAAAAAETTATSCDIGNNRRKEKEKKKKTKEGEMKGINEPANSFGMAMAMAAFGRSRANGLEMASYRITLKHATMSSPPDLAIHIPKHANTEVFQASRIIHLISEPHRQAITTLGT